MSKFPFVSVVIAAYNAERTIGKCLNSIISQDYPSDKYEIITVDDSSTDNTQEKIKLLMKKHDCIKYIKIPHSGYSKAEKIGMKLAKGEFIFLINSDCYVPKNWFGRLIEGFSSDETGGVGGGIIHVGDWYHFSWNDVYNNQKMRVSALGAYNSCFRKDVISKTGFIDETIAAEDVDLSLRVIRSGYKLIQDTSILIEHDHPLCSFVNSVKKKLYYAKSLISVLKKHDFPPFFSKKFCLMGIAIFLFPFITFPLGLRELYDCKILVKKYRRIIKKYNLEIPFIKLVFLRTLNKIITVLGKFYYYMYYNLRM